jgi:hypothetical protein
MFFEYQTGRAVVCSCDKYINIYNLTDSDTVTKGATKSGYMSRRTHYYGLFRNADHRTGLSWLGRLLLRDVLR